ncbi:MULTISPECIES: YheC/YheD family protein [Bacillus]|uniref:YheC/YheD family endospore coat-associated protein n=1 Tax=Bacillus TaxID=1386 RepID=UPI000D2039BB|nr:YheC/YheD family protein [Bacillus pumilus]AVI40354.1 spore coat associated protein [Bacillus pumilus]MCP1147751.1 YheC/YheD family protein [Bacillus sp. 1735sda2]QHQ76450.1 YheC/YheD family protein [Bacillus pumilus]
MNKNRCIIATHPASEKTIHLPVHFKQQEVIYSLALGSRLVDDFTVSYHQHPNKILLSEDLYKDLLIPYQSRADVIAIDHTLFIGPLLGIFTAGFEKSTQPLGTRSDFFINLLHSFKQHVGFAYLFGTHSIDWDKGIVEGLLYQQKTWIKKKMPLPSVIYDRLPNRKAAQSAFVQETKRKLTQDYDIPWFNPSFFNKWDIHEQLLTDEKTCPFLPHSIQLDPVDALNKIETLLHLHEVIYLKPSNGSHGDGIYQLNKTTYGITVSSNQGRAVPFDSVEHFVTNLRKDHAIQDFMAQQGIALLQIDNQPMDFRVHTNKNKYGHWTVTAAVAKISGHHTVTTHHSYGGTVKTLYDVFPEKKTRLKMLEQLSYTAITLSQVIDEKVSGHIGEIGFDLGIDQTGAIWMFEANSRPGRDVFQHVSLRNSERLIGKNLMDYAAYLSQTDLTTSDYTNVY